MYRGDLYEVYWYNGGFMYGTQKDFTGYYFFNGISEHIEIIGNIHSNQNL
jgi:hypothetical protein